MMHLLMFGIVYLFILLEFDPDANCYIPLSLIDDLFMDIPPPMGFGPKVVGVELRRKIADMKIPMYKHGDEEPRVYFSDITLACARRIIEDEYKEIGIEADLDIPPEHRANKAWKKKYILYILDLKILKKFHVKILNIV